MKSKITLVVLAMLLASLVTFSEATTGTLTCAGDDLPPYIGKSIPRG